jgi:hypothetical protein
MRPDVHPDIGIDWLAGDPARRLIEHSGQEVPVPKAALASFGPDNGVESTKTGGVDG